MVPKFMAWDKKYKMIMTVNEIDFEKNKVWLEADNGDHENRHTLTRDFNDVVLMQSTGLKDKNGVEIFEGDVVLANGVQVTVSFGEQKYEENYGDETYYIGFNVFTKMGYGMLIPVKFEVLGNIHENPELLSKPKEARV